MPIFFIGSPSAFEASSFGLYSFFDAILVSWRSVAWSNLLPPFDIAAFLKCEAIGRTGDGPVRKVFFVVSIVFVKLPAR